MQRLTLIRGLPGSGKSTLAKALVNNMSVHFEADMWMGEPYKFDRAKLKDVHAACLEATKTALEGGYDVIVSNTFVKKWEMEPYLALAKQVQVIVCQGDFGNVHGVPPCVIERMRKEFEY